MRWNKGIVPDNLVTIELREKILVQFEMERTDPIARKKENVAALLSIYCERVAMRP